MHLPDSDLEARRSSGATMVTVGILTMVGSFIYAVVASASSADYGVPAARSFQLAQSPWFVLPFFGGLALIVLGQVKKSGATREAQERFERSLATTKLVPSEDVPGGPFRGALVEVEVPDPILAQLEAAEQLSRASRGGGFLIFGIVTMGITVALMLLYVHGLGGSPYRVMQNTLLATGAAFFPFGLGLFFTIKGGLMRSK